LFSLFPGVDADFVCATSDIAQELAWCTGDTSDSPGDALRDATD